jgi:hypothetical protein
MTFSVGDACMLRPSSTVPRLSGKFFVGVVTGALGMYKCFDSDGEPAGERLGYKVKVGDTEVCAPPEMLVERQAR